MDLKPGTKLLSSSDGTEVVVVKAPSVDVELRCGGHPMVLKGDKPKVMQVGVWYDDEFVRTADGWRLSRRVEIKCYDKIL